MFFLDHLVLFFPYLNLDSIFRYRLESLFFYRFGIMTSLSTLLFSLLFSSLLFSSLLFSSLLFSSLLFSSLCFEVKYFSFSSDRMTELVMSNFALMNCNSFHIFSFFSSHFFLFLSFLSFPLISFFSSHFFLFLSFLLIFSTQTHWPTQRPMASLTISTTWFCVGFFSF
jgi:hypothetical protein